MDVLRRYPAFRRLWAARAVSFLGDAVGLVALILLVAEETGSGRAVGLLLLAGDLTPAVLSPVLGAVADRVDARRLLVTCELAQAAVVATIVVLAPPVAIVLLLVALRSLLASTFAAASRSVVAELVDDADLERANTVIGMGTHGLEAVGPLIAAALLLAFEPRHVLAFDVLTFLVSPLLLAALPRRRVTVLPERLLAGALAGLGAVRAHRPVWILALAFWGVATVTAVDDVALPFLATDDLGGDDVAVALLYAGGGVGVLVGFGLIGRLRVGAAAVALIGMAMASAGNLLTGLAPVLVLAVAMQAVRGIGNAWLGVGTDTTIQRHVPAGLRGRVFANVYGGVGLGAGLSYLGGGAAVDAFGGRTVLVVGGALGIGCAAIGAWASSSRATPTTPSPTAGSP